MRKWNVVPIALALGLFAAPAAAQVGFGPQLSYGTEAEGLGIGARVVAPVGHHITDGSESVFADLKVIGSFDWFFPDCPDQFDCSYIEINANGALPLPIEGISSYAGAGLNIVRVSVDWDDAPAGFDDGGTDTDVGLNILGGIDFPMDAFTPFAEARLELGGGEQFVITAGILF